METPILGYDRKRTESERLVSLSFFTLSVSLRLSSYFPISECWRNRLTKLRQEQQHTSTRFDAWAPSLYVSSHHLSILGLYIAIWSVRLIHQVCGKPSSVLRPLLSHRKCWTRQRQSSIYNWVHGGSKTISSWLEISSRDALEDLPREDVMDP